MENFVWWAVCGNHCCIAQDAVSLLFIAGRNEVVAKVMFLQVCVCPRGGVCLSACWDAIPPGWRTPWVEKPPLGPGRPPTPHPQPPDGESPRDQADPPDGELPQMENPPRDQADPQMENPPPPGKQTPAYGLRAAGTHPTRMHSCYFVRSSTSVIWFLHSNRLKKYSSLVQKTYPITHSITTFHWDDEYILKQPNQKIILNFFKRSSRLNGPFLLQQFLAISVAWILSGVLTASGAFPDDPTSDGFKASTDSKSGVLAESPFFYFPYPCAYWQYNWNFHDKGSSRSNMSFNSTYECVKLVLHIKLVVLADLVF